MIKHLLPYKERHDAAGGEGFLECEDAVVGLVAAADDELPVAVLAGPLHDVVFEQVAGAQGEALAVGAAQVGVEARGRKQHQLGGDDFSLVEGVEVAEMAGEGLLQLFEEGALQVILGAGLAAIEGVVENLQEVVEAAARGIRLDGDAGRTGGLYVLAHLVAEALPQGLGAEAEVDHDVVVVVDHLAVIGLMGLAEQGEAHEFGDDPVVPGPPFQCGIEVPEKIPAGLPADHYRSPVTIGGDHIEGLANFRLPEGLFPQVTQQEGIEHAALIAFPMQSPGKSPFVLKQRRISRVGEDLAGGALLPEVEPGFIVWGQQGRHRDLRDLREFSDLRESVKVRSKK